MLKQVLKNQSSSKINKIIKADKSVTQAKFDMEKSRQKPSQRKVTPSKTMAINNSQLNKTPKHDLSKSFSMNKKSFKDDLQFYLQCITKSKNNLCECLQLCKLIETSHQQQRCFQHNNTLTLYCITQRKLICVNCIYGVHRHRTHRILPIKDNIQFVAEDNKNLKNKLDQQLTLLDVHIQQSKTNTLLLQDGLKKTLIDIQAEFRKARENLEKSFDREKTNALKRYEQLIQKSQEVNSRLQQLKYTVWQSTSKYNFNRPKMDQDQQISKQLILNKVIESIYVSCRAVTPQQLDKIYSRKNKLTILSEQMQTAMSKNNSRQHLSKAKK